MGNSGCERSSAWTRVFSSAHNTSALAGGCKYRPTISRTFSINSGSLEELKSCGRECGCKAEARQMWVTALWLKQLRLAMDRVGQWVASGGRFSRVKVSTTAASVILRGARNAVRRAGHSAAAPQTGHATCPPWVGSNASVAPPDYYFFLVHKPARCEPAAAGLGRTRTPHPALQGFAFFSAQLQKRNRSSQRHRHLTCILDTGKPKLIQHIHDSKHSRFVCSQNQSEIHAWILAVQIAHEMFRESTTMP